MNIRLSPLFVLKLFISVTLIFFTHVDADAFNSKIFPATIKPGDAFAIRVSGTNIPGVPSASLNEKEMLFSSCGESCFISIGVADTETKPGVYKILLYIGTKKTNLTLSVKSVKFPTLHMTLPEEKVFLRPEDLERAEREEERLKSIWKTATGRLWEGNFIIPLANDISTGFGTKRIMNKKKESIHTGVDIKGKTGEEIKASNRGKVVLTEELFFGGNTIILDHGLGIFTIYMHLSSFNVKPGNIVSKGDTIGFVGSSGRASGPHLHFGVKVMDTNANPLSLVRLKL